MIRRAEENDLERILTLVDQARKDMKTMGIPQWQGVYPSPEDIQADIRNGEGYVIVRDDIVEAYTCMKEGPDPNYSYIEKGRWCNEDPYLVLHRTAVDHACKGHGLAGQFYAFAVEEGKRRGIHNIRIDTHDQNEPMKHSLIKAGFVCCGIVYMWDGKKRNAYQKVF
jgi:GNAT superfamily N-acetyltransferase